MWRGLIETYRDRLPVTGATPVVTLHEGNTPLVPAPVLSSRLGADVYLKVEGANPTGSFKDRGMTMAVSKAVEAGNKAIICASTGNTSASAAAYAARAGITCAVLVPQGKIALGKLAQALVHGARLLQVSGNFDDCLALAAKLAQDYPVALVNSVNPDRLHGQKTAAFEIVEALGDAPDIHCLPVGNAGNISAYWMGYNEDFDAGNSTRRPEDVRLPGRRRRPDRQRPGGPGAVHHRHRDPDRQPGELDQGARRPGRLRRADRRGHRPGDPGRVPAARPRGRRLRRAGQRGERRRPAAVARPPARCRPAPPWSARSPGTGSRTRSGRSPPPRRRSPSPTTCWPRRGRSTWPDPRRREPATGERPPTDVRRAVPAPCGVGCWPRRCRRDPERDIDPPPPHRITSATVRQTLAAAYVFPPRSEPRRCRCSPDSVLPIEG